MKLQLLAILATLCFLNRSIAQNCPANIDFETGTFNNWTCYTGYTSAVGADNVISITSSGGPAPTRHTMYSATANAGELDPFGNFPVVCPNGSGHSIRLGNSFIITQ